MKIDLDIVHSCTIKRKKPWPRITWIGKEKQQIFLFDHQRVSVLDPKTGKTRKRVNKISSLFKNVIATNLSDSKVYLVGILNTGDLFVWNKDTDVIKTVTGMKDFAYKLGFHSPSVFINDEASKILIITSRNKVFLFESDYKPNFHTSQLEICDFINASTNIRRSINGNWSNIVAPKDIKTVEDNKELALHARFKHTETEGTTVTCCFVFNYENRLTITTLNIKWLNRGEIQSLSQCNFESVWTSYVPCIEETLCTKYEHIHSRGAYVCKLSNNCEIIALAINQKYVHKTCLTFMSSTNGAIYQSNLRSFGLNETVKGRHYWIQDMNWMYNDLYLGVVTKHGAVFIVPRLGNPISIQATGSDVNIGPALYITFHPLIVLKRTTENDPNVSTTNTINSNTENDFDSAVAKQHYSITNHPTLPIFLCSDGYLITIFTFKQKLINEFYLIRELLYETIRLLNSILKNKLNFSTTKLRLKHDNDQAIVKIPDWNLNTIKNDQIQLSGDSCNNNDSGVDAYDTDHNNNQNAKSLITDGKIIFSYIPQIQPISFETLELSTAKNKNEITYEYLQNTWNLLLTSTVNRHVNDEAVKIFENLFLKYILNLLTLDVGDFTNAKLLKNVNEYELKVNYVLFYAVMNFYKVNQFATNSTTFYISLNLLYKILISLLTNDYLNENYICLVKYLYRFIELLQASVFNGDACLSSYFDKCWFILLKHLKNSYLKKVNMAGNHGADRSAALTLKEYEYFIVLIQNNLKNFLTYNEEKKIAVNKGYEFSLNNNLDDALDYWKNELINKFILKTVNTKTTQRLSTELSHKILYTCLINQKLNKLISILNSLLQLHSKSQVTINLYTNTFLLLHPRKQLNLTHTSVLTMLQSFTRLVALYFIQDTKLRLFKKSNKFIKFPNIIDVAENRFVDFDDYTDLTKDSLTNAIKFNRNLKKIFNYNKIVELLLLTNLFDEAIYFTYCINDVKSTYLLSSIMYYYFKDSQNIKINFNLVLNKLLFFDDDLGDERKLAFFIRNENMLSKILLSTVLVNDTDMVKMLIRYLLDNIASVIYTQLNVVIDNEFYLPAPPIYCEQTLNAQTNQEYKIRIKLNFLIKYLIQIFISSNLHVSLMKWYLNELYSNTYDMNTKYNILNEFKLTPQLNTLLKLIKYHKINSINDEILYMFRDFCALLFYLDIRDKFSLNLRKYYNLNGNSNTIKICTNIIDYGTCLLSFRCLFKQQQQHLEIQNLILNAIIYLNDNTTEFNLDKKLVNCVLKQPLDAIKDTNEGLSRIFVAKQDGLLNKWKSNTNAKLYDNYNDYLNVKRSACIKLLTIYGLPEDDIFKIYIHKLPRSQPNLVCSYDYERTAICGEFFEFLFKIGFNSYENWENVLKYVNKVPITQEFYEDHCDFHLDFNLNEYTYKGATDSPKQRRRRRRRCSVSKDGEQLELDNVNEASIKKSASLTDLRNANPESPIDRRKSVSFSNLKKQNPVAMDSLSDEENDVDDELNMCKVIDFGPNYAHYTQLAIWLVKTFKDVNFNEISEYALGGKSAYKLTCINANMLVGCVYLANTNKLDRVIAVQKKVYIDKEAKSANEDFTDVTNLAQNHQQVLQQDETYNEITNSIQKIVHPQKEEQENGDEELDEESSTLNLSSMNDDGQGFLSNRNRTPESHDLMSKTPNDFRPTSKHYTDDVSRFTTITEEYEDKLLPQNKQHIQPPTIAPRTINEQLLVSSKAVHQQHQDTGKPISEMVRDEIKKLVQMQHNVVMNFLNADVGDTPSPQLHPFQASTPPQAQTQPSFNNMNATLQNNVLNQLKHTQLDANGKPVEFIIETKVRTSSGLTLFDTKYAPPESHATLARTKSYETTSQINMPLLNFKRNTSPERLRPTSSQLTLNLPIIKEAWLQSHGVRETRYAEDDEDEDGDEEIFPMARLDTNRKLKTSPRKDTSQMPKLLTSKKLNVPPSKLVEHHKPAIEQTNRFIQEFINAAKSQTPASALSQFAHNFPLLRLNYKHAEMDKVKEKPVPAEIADVDEAAREAEVVQALKPPIRQKPETPKKVDQAVEASRPLYDGYILKPGMFDEMLISENAKVFDAHFKATEHLREKPTVPQSSATRRETFTMTDNIDSMAISPDILFKLKFDSKKKGRESSDLNAGNDYVNVADLDAKSVEDVLKLIEHEQLKRKEKPMIIKPREPVPRNKAVNEDVKRDVDLVDVASVPDPLTEKLFRNDDVNFEYMHENLMSSDARQISKRQVTNDLRLLDEKIKIMNEIANNMNEDFGRYNKIIDTVNEYSQIVDKVKQPEPLVEPRKQQYVKAKDELKEDKKNMKFYKKSEAIENVDNFKRAVDEKAVVMEPVQSENQVRIVKKEVKIVEQVDDEELSDLKENEKEKLRDILAIESTSISNLLKQVMMEDDENNQTLIQGEEVEIEERAEVIVQKRRVQNIKPKDNPNLTHIIEEPKFKTIPSISSKSPVRHKSPTSNSQKLNVTYKVPTSTLVRLEKEKAEKRDSLKQQFMKAREHEAAQLLTDLLADDSQAVTSARNPPRQRSKETQRSPSLDSMSRTIIKLQKENEVKHAQTEQLLHNLENRSLNRTHSIEDTGKVRKAPVDSYQNYVHVQEPAKLKQFKHQKPLTYTEQLKRHQDNKTHQARQTDDELFKIYGTKRVPGIYKPYEKPPNERKVKTYSERVQALRPNVDYTVVVKAPARIPVRAVKHDLVKKKKAEHKKDMNRYRPYNVAQQPVNDEQDVAEVLSWSLDDKMHNILYGAHKKPHGQSQLHQKRDTDQDTLADIDEFMNNDVDYRAMLTNHDYTDENDYVNDVNTEDLRNIVSISSESNLSYIDWDQIAKITGTN